MRRYLAALALLAVLLPALGWSATVKTIRVKSAALGKRVNATVVLPASYRGSDSTYPVLYLLHGWGSDNTVWRSFAPLDNFADRFGLIIVCPTAGPASWYLDSPFHKAAKAETFIVKELVPAVDSRYRTVWDARGRALLGSSMGGHGALTLLARHPDVFARAGSISGIMDLRAHPKDWGIAALLGPLAGNDSLWLASSFIGQVWRLKGKNVRVLLDCGSDDETALSGNRDARRMLTAFNVAVDYRESPGTHTREFVVAVLGSQVERLAQLLRPPAP